MTTWNVKFREGPLWRKVLGKKAHWQSVKQTSAGNFMVGLNNVLCWLLIGCLFKVYPFLIWDQWMQTYEECRFFLESSTAKIWTVPWSLAAQSSDESELKFKLFSKKEFCQIRFWPMMTTLANFYQYIVAGWAPRLSSLIRLPDDVSNILISVPLNTKKSTTWSLLFIVQSS